MTRGNRQLRRYAPVILLLAHSAAGQTIPPEASKPIPLQATSSEAEHSRGRAEIEPARKYSLAELIDLGERNNPETRIAWERAKQRAAQLGVARAALFPIVAVAALAQQSRYRVLFGSAFYRQDLTDLQPTLMVSYTLLDFGSREAGIQIAKAGLVAADFLFNNAHRQIIYGVTAAYYRLNSALAQEDAALAALTNAQTVQSAAEARLNNGLATLPDVLEARAATAQASYELETIRGAERLAHGQLAEALGVRPTASIQVQNLQALEMPVISDSADGFIKRALERRPDLLAEVTQLKAADAGIRAARSRYYPQVAFSGSADYEYLHGYQPPGPAASIDGETWLAKLSATWTLFDGGARYNDLDRARSERRQAQEEVNAAADRIEDEVWAAYSNVETSLHRQEAARALLTASEQSYNAVLEAYKYGVKNFLDVVSAQRTLAQARTEQVQSQAEVLTSFAQLAFASGDLAPSPKP